MTSGVINSNDFPDFLWINYRYYSPNIGEGHSWAAWCLLVP